MKHRNFQIASIIVFLLAVTFMFPAYTGQAPTGAGAPVRRDHQVHIAFGFHVNLCHSYRGDRDDESGFGKDIRIIRRIIRALDEANERGVPVKGVWDADNLFSLGEILPKYAPDVIEGIRRRVADNGDEVILMSHNNGLASAMTRPELETSIRRAIHNDQGSGVEDLFGRYSPIVRPQEMMITPGQYKAYQDLGLKAVVLYYSAVTFDAFRVFSRRLRREESFNPLLYRNPDTDEEMVVIPARNIGDMVENVSLGRLARSLHRDQQAGVIDRDVLIFLNFDADDEFWSGYDAPWHLSGLPNTGGLKALIDEVSNLEYVRFTTLAEYLDHHQPVGIVRFGQDLADGNFNGYNSWSEKAGALGYWTRIEADRRADWFARQAAGFAGQPADAETLSAGRDLRLRLMSTTHFGMSTPFVAPAREAAGDEIARSLTHLDAQIETQARARVQKALARRPPPVPPRPLWRLVDRVFAAVPPEAGTGGMGMFFPLNLGPAQVGRQEALYLCDPAGELTRLIPLEADDAPDTPYGRVRLFAPGVRGGGVYTLWAAPAKPDNRDGHDVVADARLLQNEFIKVRFTEQGLIEGVYFQGQRRLTPGSLLPFVRYRTDPDGSVRAYRPHNLSLTVEQDGSSGAASVRLRGDWRIDGAPGSRTGRMDYRLTLIEGLPHLFIQGGVVYPRTLGHEVVTGAHPSLVRKMDARWIEAGPVEMGLTDEADRDLPFRVIKRNFMGVVSHYDLDYFRRNEANLGLADVNNHVTAGFAALASRSGGTAVAMDTTVTANFAFCPVKVRPLGNGDRFTARVNPFGAYFGPQYRPPADRGGLGFDTFLALGGQYRSSAPSYNGFGHDFSLMVSFFNEREMPGKLVDALTAFAYPALVVPESRIDAGPGMGSEVPDNRAPSGFTVSPDHDRSYFVWNRERTGESVYKLAVGRSPGSFDRAFFTSEARATIDGLTPGQTYYARLSVMDNSGRPAATSEEISFTAGRPATPSTVEVPVLLQLRFLAAYLGSFFE